MTFAGCSPRGMAICSILHGNPEQGRMSDSRGWFGYSAQFHIAHGGLPSYATRRCIQNHAGSKILETDSLIPELHDVP
jgi:hypothetical protein